ncbi:nucleoside triphosphate pyrophosphohydrolase [Nordella sp. HKS 07]|uniref:nucleoside triphosphate pyrophosphohydrolase n=1 Tax=Nordella sp. HKS 07 TaxID=2712222 RepID=UPI0013E1951C|nr:nucleoside triphosphate pyrophosphohydrolase [Nordella sp. HKS 07]QIG51316.1 nucleoside triphosphate pyrophosphohydrolase [Nordella sp. HKS 07]
MTNPADLDPRQLATLRAIMKALRTPGTGCPWDLEQDFSTIAPYTIEEAYEVADAITRGDKADLCEELGDLLLQVVYHAQLAAEEKSFSFDDVVEAICRKMIRRHPHVFGDEEARSAKLAKGFWEEMKAREKTAGGPKGVLDGVPVGLPAMTRAVKLQAKAAKVGFDWPSIDFVYDKMNEEIAELKQETARDAQEAEYGDLLFAMANLGRHLDIDPEAALRAANEKFLRRFRHIEQELAGRGSSPGQSTLEEMDALWDDAKRIERERDHSAA